MRFNADRELPPGVSVCFLTEPSHDMIQMTTKCPTCGHEVAVINFTAAQVLSALKADPRRDVYETIKGNEFWVSYQGGGPISGETIGQMLEQNLLKARWPDDPKAKCYILTHHDP